MVGIARVHEALGDGAKAAAQYKKVLTHDASNVEAIACMAANHFYSDQPELALRFYRRLLQVILALLLLPPPTPRHTPSCALALGIRTHTPVLTRACAPLLQMGVNNAELWCNVGLCCFYASQYDMALSCLERALALSSDDAMADVWYNIGQVAIGIGDLGLAYQAFKIAISEDSNHAEAYTNLGVLELRKVCAIAPNRAPHLLA